MVRVALMLVVSITAMPAIACNSELLVFESWVIEPIDDRNNRITTVFRSNAEQPIRMIDASAGYVDALGGDIGSFRLNRDILVEPGGAYEETKRWGPHTFERLLTLRPGEVSTYTCTRSVLYEDGTVERFD